MLTEKEQKLIDVISGLTKGFADIRDEAIEATKYYHDNGVTYELECYSGDYQEIVYHIHALQNWVLANSAAREYHNKYRLFGTKET